MPCFGPALVTTFLGNYRDGILYLSVFMRLVPWFFSQTGQVRAKLREVADQLEGVVSDEFWPLPTYQEMLFIK
jgi:hypothetical protein